MALPRPGGVTEDLGDALRRLAADGPSDDGLLAGVHAASARAAVRRRALLSSAAAFVVLAAGAVVGNLGDAPAGNGLVLGSASSPTDAPVATPDPTAAVGPTAEATASGPAAERTIPPGMYGGRAVSPGGKPIEGLHVYVIAEVASGWTHRAQRLTRTRDDGTFEIPCPAGPVLLNAFRLDRPQDGSEPNWMTTFVGGAHLLDRAATPACAGGRHTSVVPRGVEVRGQLRGPASCSWAGWSVQLEAARADESDGRFGHVSRDQGDLNSRALADAEGRFRFAGLPPGHHWGFLASASWGWSVGYDIEAQHVEEPQRGSYEITFDVPASQCSPPSSTPDASPSAEPGVSPSAGPEITPTPEPEVT